MNSIVGALRQFGALRQMGRLRDGLLLALVVIGLVAGPALAQELSTAERATLQAQKEALFQRMVRNPGNLDAAFAYAGIAAKLGDNEAAVSALERMLMFNPHLPRVQLELGALYFRMGSYEVAQTYFERALAANPPAAVKARVQTYLAQIARLSAPQRFSGFVFFGGQYQSDANIAPGSPLIRSPIGDVLLSSQFTKKNDFDIFGTGSFLYSYDLGTQTRDTIDVTGTGFANHYARVDRLDLAVAELTVGPRFNFVDPLSWVSSASLKPYLIANDVGLGGNQYFHTFGVGAEATAVTWRDIHVKSLFEFRDKNFNNAPDRPLSRGLNGNDKLFSLFVSKPITANPDSELTLEFDFLDQQARKIQTIFGPLDYYSSKTYAGAAAYRIRYDDPTGYLHYPWETTVFLSRSWSDYAAPDPCCVVGGGFSERLDRRWRFGVTQSFQVSNNIAVVVQLQRDIVSSDLPLYAYSNNSILVGPQIRF
ncbi:MAG TPA: tetratricopeptide repeat protein [Stellaceae bacterium]|nr:tetratricopeptide repeat protein [Stellaceae bacterium]